LKKVGARAMMPRRTKLPIRPGERISPTDSILEIWVPALAKAKVPGMIPMAVVQAKVEILTLDSPPRILIKKNGKAGINLRVSR